MEVTTQSSEQTLRSRHARVQSNHIGKIDSIVKERIGLDKENDMKPESTVTSMVTRTVTALSSISRRMSFQPRWSNEAKYSIKARAPNQSTFGEDDALKRELHTALREYAELFIRSAEHSTIYPFLPSSIKERNSDIIDKVFEGAYFDCFHERLKKRSVVVVGSGVSGMLMCLLLKKMGVGDVTLYEASPRLGGRLGTFFSAKGTPMEFGAMRFPTENTALQSCMRWLGVRKVPFHNQGPSKQSKTLLFKYDDADSQWSFSSIDLNANETLQAMLKKSRAFTDSIKARLAESKSDADKHAAWADHVRKHELDVSMVEWMKKNFTNEETEAWLQFGTLGGPGHHMKDFEALSILGIRLEFNNLEELFTIEGGCQRLIDAFRRELDQLGIRVCTSHSVSAVSPAAQGHVRIEGLSGIGAFSNLADAAAICTPLFSYKRMDTPHSPDLTLLKKQDGDVTVNALSKIWYELTPEAESWFRRKGVRRIMSSDPVLSNIYVEEDTMLVYIWSVELVNDPEKVHNRLSKMLTSALAPEGFKSVNDIIKKGSHHFVSFCDFDKWVLPFSTKYIGWRPWAKWIDLEATNIVYASADLSGKAGWLEFGLQEAVVASATIVLGLLDAEKSRAGQWKRLASSVGIIAIAVIVMSSQALGLKWVFDSGTGATFAMTGMLFFSAFCVALSSLLLKGWRGFGKLSLRLGLSIAVAGCFSGANFLLTPPCVKFLGAGTYAILFNFSIVTTCVLERLLLRIRKTTVHWLALTLVTVGVLVYSQDRLQTMPQDFQLGVVFLCLKCLANASYVVSRKYVANVSAKVLSNVELISLFAITEAIIYLIAHVVLDYEQLMFTGWDWRVILVALPFMAVHPLVVLMMKTLTPTVMKFSGVLASFFIFFVSALFFGEKASFIHILGVIVTLTAMVLYNIS